MHKPIPQSAILFALLLLSSGGCHPRQSSMPSPAAASPSQQRQVSTLDSEEDAVAPLPEEDAAQSAPQAPADGTSALAEAVPGFVLLSVPEQGEEAGYALFLQSTELSQVQWQALMGSNPSFHQDCPQCPVEQLSWYEALLVANAWSRSEGLQECYRVEECTGELGVVCAAHDGPGCVEAFRCAQVSFVGLSCEGYRLPTNAEWEYAASAGTASAVVDSTPMPSGAAWEEQWLTLSTPRNENATGTSEVGLGTPNAWGLYDMRDNVWEWVWDAAEPFGASQLEREQRFLRGGSWLQPGEREDGQLESIDAGVRDRQIGVRLARSLPQSVVSKP